MKSYYLIIVFREPIKSIIVEYNNEKASETGKELFSREMETGTKILKMSVDWSNKHIQID